MSIYLILSLLFLDQITKIIAVKFLKNQPDISVITDFFKLSYVENTGAAFGSFYNYTFLLSLITAVFLFVLLFMIKNSKNKLEQFGLYLILTGAIGNFIDRIRNGYVIDFFDFDFFDIQFETLKISIQRWPVFNFADSYICIGVFIVLLSIFLSKNHQNS